MAMGLAIFLGGAKMADGINRVATPVLLSLFCSLFFVGMQARSCPPPSHSYDIIILYRIIL